jgi:DNA-binding protein HU-beta
MNKSQLVDALADRLGDRRTAADAVDALLQIVVDTVRAGDSVSLAGFGVFERRARAARTGRNPRTGETVAVPATTIPAFRPGTGFRSAVAGDEEPAGQTPAPRRRSGTAGATNGASPSGGATVNGSVELPAPQTAILLAPDETPDALPGGPPAKGKKKEKPAPKDAKAARDSDKVKKKGKKDE